MKKTIITIISILLILTACGLINWNLKKGKATKEEEKIENQIEINLSTIEIPNVTEIDEENLEEQEVEDEGFELQGEIAYDGGKEEGWNLNVTGTPKLTYISQIDSRWKNYPYTVTNNKKQTIGTSGCGVAAAAMIIDSIVGNVSVTELADAFVKHGYRSPNNGTYWSANRAIADEFDIDYKETSNFNVMLGALKNCNYIIASVGNGLFTTGGHYIMIYGLDGENLKIYDPYLYAGKFETSTRRGKAAVNGNTVYCSLENFKTYANYKRFFCYKYDEKKVDKNNSTDNNVVTQSYEMYVKVSTRLNIRNGAGTGYKVIGKLYNGKKVTVYETKNGWSKIGENMWVSSDYLSKKNNENNVGYVKNTVGQYKRLRSRTFLYSNLNLTGKKYTYLAKTQVKIIKNISASVDYVYVVKTGRYAYIKNSSYK